MDIELLPPPAGSGGSACRGGSRFPKTLGWLRPVRRCVQWGVIAGLCLLPWANAQGWLHIQGSFFALNIYGLPFADPLSALQSFLLGYGDSINPSLWVGALLTLLLAVLFGRVFCGWICPYGLLSEYAFAFRHGKKSAAGGAKLGPDARGKRGKTSVRPVMGRSFVCALGIVAALWWGIPFLQRLSMPGELSLLPLRAWEMGMPEEYGWQYILLLVAVPAVTLLVDCALGRRFWCTWICPQSVVLSWVALAGRRFGGVRWSPKACTCVRSYSGTREPEGESGAELPCERACSLHLAVRQKGGPDRGECSQCLDCVAACSCKGGALRLGLFRNL